MDHARSAAAENTARGDPGIPTGLYMCGYSPQSGGDV